MKILQWIKNIFKKNEVKQLKEPKKVEFLDWKEMYRHKGNNIAEKEMTLQEKRREQIKSVEFLILYQEGKLLKKDIWKEILETYEENVLENIDMEALVVLYCAIKEQDVHGDYEIRDFMEDDKYNIVKLIDKMIENAKKESKIYKDRNVCDLIDGSFDSINQIIKELDSQKDLEEENEK